LLDQSFVWTCGQKLDGRDVALSHQVAAHGRLRE
jgi:hypothetical protein